MQSNLNCVWGGKRKEIYQYNFSHLSCSFSLQWNWGSRGSCWSLPPRKRTRRRRSVAPSSCARQSSAPSRWRRPLITDLCAEPSTAVTKHRVSITLSFLRLCGLNIRMQKLSNIVFYSINTLQGLHGFPAFASRVPLRLRRLEWKHHTKKMKRSVLSGWRVQLCFLSQVLTRTSRKKTWNQVSESFPGSFLLLIK